MSVRSTSRRFDRHRGGQPLTNVTPVTPRLPPAPSWPQIVVNAAYMTRGVRLMRAFYDRFGTAFSMDVPFFGPSVVISDPDLAKELFKQPLDAVRAAEPNLGLVLGPGSSFGLHGEKHLRHRRLLLPPFHGDRMRAYEGLIEAETLQETLDWPEGQEFPVREAMMRITLNTILRGIFGAEGAEFDALRSLMPPMIRLGSKLVLVPALHRDLGRWSPWGRLKAMRSQLDDILTTLIARARSDPALEQRTDVLSLLLQARYDDGTPMSDCDIGDELFTLLVAGHETTATSLAWAVERLRRHRELLARLVTDVDAGQSALLQATVQEVLRTRPIIDAVSREVTAESISLGPWVIPRGYIVTVNIGLVHQNESVYSDAAAFNPERFLGNNPDIYSWLPFGGGTRRCPGAAFANMEMTVVLRTILREFTLIPTDAPDERRQSRGVVFAPSDDGRAVVYRRRDGR
jgi:cytochrome P450 family 138